MKIFEKHIQSYTHNGHIGVLVEFGLESSLPLRSEIFSNFTKDIAMHIASEKPEGMDVLFSQKFIKDTKVSIRELIQQFTEILSEKICVTRFVRWDTEYAGPEPKPDEPPPKSPAVALQVVK